MQNIEIKPEIHEANLAEVAGILQAKREKGDMQEAPGEEQVRKSIEEISKQHLENDKKELEVLPSYMSKDSDEVKLEVERLLTMVFQDGIQAAAKEAAKSNPYVLDAFHDSLTGHLYPELKKRGIVE